MSHAWILPPTPQGETATAIDGSFEVAARHDSESSTTVELRGEMDLATADLAGAVLDNQLESGYRFVRLDLSALTFLDGTALRVLVEAHNRFLGARGRLLLTEMCPLAARLFRITNLDEALAIEDKPDPLGRRATQHLRAVREP